MKINLLKFVLLNIFLLLSSLSSYAFHTISAQTINPDDKSPIKTAISVQTGLMNGLAKELVYSKAVKISELDWDLKPLYFTGFSFNTIFFDKLFLNTGAWMALNENAGRMTDHDYSEKGELINYSRHQCVFQKAVNYDVNSGYKFTINERFSLSGLVGFNYYILKMNARNGYFQYPIGTASQPFYGTGIALEQSYYVPYVGLGVVINTFNQMFFTRLFSIYSKLVYCSEKDYHFRRQIDIFSSMKYGQYISVIAEQGWRINDYNSLVFSFQFVEIVTAKGDTYYYELTTGGKTSKRSNTSQAGLRVLSYTISVEHSLRWL